eukprot:5918916-Pleurochrysis_carterae.AAC.1
MIVAVRRATRPCPMQSDGLAMRAHLNAELGRHMFESGHVKSGSAAVIAWLLRCGSLWSFCTQRFQLELVRDRHAAAIRANLCTGGAAAITEILEFF